MSARRGVIARRSDAAEVLTVMALPRFDLQQF